MTQQTQRPRLNPVGAKQTGQAQRTANQAAGPQRVQQGNRPVQGAGAKKAAPVKSSISAERRAKMRADLNARADVSTAKLDDKGKFRDFFEPDKMTNIPRFKPKKDEYMFDIVPYFAGTQDPQCAPDTFTYVLDVFVHPKVGATEDTYICPAQYKGRRCPICEERTRRSNNDEDYDTRVKPLNTTRKVVYNVILRDGGKEEAKGIQVFEIAHWFMERHLIKQAKDPRGKRLPFFDDQEGSTVYFERTGTGKDSTNYEGHKFIERLTPITDADLDAAYVLDELIHIPTYEELADAFYGAAENEGGNTEGGYAESDDEPPYEPEDGDGDSGFDPNADMPC